MFKTIKDKKEWFVVLIIFIAIGFVVISYKIGYNDGEEDGIKKSIRFISSELTENMQDPCLTKFLSKLNLSKDKK